MKSQCELEPSTVRIAGNGKYMEDRSFYIAVVPVIFGRIRYNRPVYNGSNITTVAPFQSSYYDGNIDDKAIMVIRSVCTRHASQQVPSHVRLAATPSITLTHTHRCTDAGMS